MSEKRDRGDIIKAFLVDERLSYGWLIRQLMAEGLQTDKCELSLFLSGKRQTPKAQQVIDRAEAILKRYQTRFLHQKSA